MSRFVVTDTPLAGVRMVRRQPLEDARGCLSRLFCAQELASAGWSKPVAQINHSVTRRRGTVRGMHYQNAPHAEMKLVSCLRGEVWDVAVDLRTGSPTFLHWYAQPLSAANRCALLIPEGCAHGFQALSDDAELLYCHSTHFVPLAQAAVHPLDPRLAIDWPLPPLALSQRDADQAWIDAQFVGVRW